MKLPRTLLVWPPLAAVVAGVAAWSLTGHADTAWAAALAAALFSFVTGYRVTQHWMARTEALAAAARGLTVEPVDGWAPDDPDNPAALARRVQSTTESAREMARQLAVLRAVIDGMAEGVWITSEDGTVLEHNNALKEMLYAGQQLAGHRPVELVRSAELQQAVEKACRDNQPSRLEISVEGVRPRVLSIHISPLGRDLGGSAAVFFDVTELRRLEKVRKDFVANVSHELRTPITAIRGYAETLKSGALHDGHAAPKMVDIIHRQSERLSELVEDLLELSRLESRQLQLGEHPVDLLEAAARAADTVRPKAKARQVSIELDLPEGLCATGDQRAIEQILLNLLDNAVKYTRPSGNVWVSGRRDDQRVELAVRDDGPGIESRHLPRIFERFYRVDKGRSRDMGGTGLGLSIVKHLMTAMSGEVRVESTPGVGSTFYVQFAAAPPEAREKPVSAEAPAAPVESSAA